MGGPDDFWLGLGLWQCIGRLRWLAQHGRVCGSGALLGCRLGLWGARHHGAVWARFDAKAAQ